MTRLWPGPAWQDPSMARLRGSVVLTPIPRDWFDENVGLGHDVVGEFLGQLPLGGGEHLAPGSWYSTDELQVSIDAWSRRGETAGRINLTDEHSVTIMSVRLVSASVPRLAEATGDIRLTTGGFL